MLLPSYPLNILCATIFFLCVGVVGESREEHNFGMGQSCHYAFAWLVMKTQRFLQFHSLLVLCEAVVRCWILFAVHVFLLPFIWGTLFVCAVVVCVFVGASFVTDVKRKCA